MVAYGRKVYGIGERLRGIVDSRRAPQTSAELVAATVFYTGLLRIRSFNALEPRLGEKPFLRLVGAAPERGRLCSVDTVGRSLCRMDLDSVRAVSLAMLAEAERNKVFREGWHGALRYMAIDGWEPFCSRRRHCTECLDRRVRVKGRGEELEEVIEFYHRYAVGLLIDERFDLLLDFEPLLPKDLRPLIPKGRGSTARLVKAAQDEGELTAATRLVKRVKQTFGWIDVVVGDALYANGPFLTTLHRLGLGAVIIARKENEEPLHEALQLWADQAPHKIVEDEKAREKIALWDCHDLETLTTYEGKVRCVRGRVTRLDRPEELPRTWCMLVTGKPATRLTPEKVLAVARARWHIENTAFHQWTTRWRLGHVFRHHPQALLCLFWLFLAAFNLLTLFQYLQLRSYGRDCGKRVTRTLSRLVDQMLDELARWNSSAWDTN